MTFSGTFPVAKPADAEPSSSADNERDEAAQKIAASWDAMSKEAKDRWIKGKIVEIGKSLT